MGETGLGQLGFLLMKRRETMMRVNMLVLLCGYHMLENFYDAHLSNSDMSVMMFDLWTEL